MSSILYRNLRAEIVGRRGGSYQLGGLTEERALALVAGDRGWPLTTEELAAARRLLAAVDGQPLHLRQCVALARGQAFLPGTCPEGGVRPGGPEPAQH